MWPSATKQVSAVLSEAVWLRGQWRLRPSDRGVGEFGGERRRLVGADGGGEHRVVVGDGSGHGSAVGSRAADLCTLVGGGGIVGARRRDTFGRVLRGAVEVSRVHVGCVGGGGDRWRRRCHVQCHDGAGVDGLGGGGGAVL